MKVICISGKAQHGKDTTASIMASTLRERGFRVLVAHYADLLKYICKMFFGWDGKKDEDGRQLLQYVGTDVIRAQDQNFWVRFIGSVLNLFPDEWDFVLIPDTRFPNEISAMNGYGFDVSLLRVIRDGFDNGLTEKQKNHPSETSLDGVKADYTIHNNGPMSDLIVDVHNLIDSMIEPMPLIDGYEVTD